MTDENKTASVVEQARERFKLVCEAEENQREREKADLRFQIPEYQWNERDRKQREGDGVTAPRPTLSISKLDQPLSLVVNQFRNADLGITVQPISEDADDETAEMIQGLYRHIERKSRAELARAWAFDRSVKCGRGAYRVLTEPDDESPDQSDQRIVIRRILHQDGVYFDPAATEPDFSDGQFAFVVAWMKRDDFKRQFPKSKAAATTEKLAWEGLTNEAPDWVREGDVLVAEYFYKVEEEGRTKVRWCKLNGWEQLEKGAWPGRFIPLIPAIGRELQPFDNERRYVGMIGPAKDGQKLYNSAASALVERMNLEPKAPFVVDPRQIEGYEKFWQFANTKNWAYLPAHFEIKGVAVGPPQRAQLDQGGMSLAMMALQESDQFIQATTAVFDPSLGRLPQKERSGKAIMALQQQADAGTSHYLQNFADVSMTYEARVVLDAMPYVYDRPERVVRIVRGDDKKAEQVMLGAPFMRDPKTGRAMPAPGRQGQPGVKYFDLSRGVYDVSISVGKSFQTRLQEGSDRIGEFLANTKDPRMALALMDIYLNFQDWPGAKEMGKRMAKLRETAMPGLGEGEDGQPTTEMMMGKIQQQGQQIEQMGQVMQQMQMALETEQAKQQATMMKAQLDAETKRALSMQETDAKVRIAAADNETKLAIANLTKNMDAILALLNLESEQRQVEAANQQAEADRALQAEQGASEQGMERERMDREDMRGARQMRHEAVMTELNRPEPQPPRMK